MVALGLPVIREMVLTPKYVCIVYLRQMKQLMQMNQSTAIRGLSTGI